MYSSLDMYTGKVDPPKSLCINVAGCLNFAWSIDEFGSKFSRLFAEKSSSYGLNDKG